MKKLVLLIVAFAFASTAIGGQFSDVPKTHWAYGAVEVLVDAGIFDDADGQFENTDGKFHGKRLLNRYHMAIITAKIIKQIDPATGAPGKSIHFTDVPKTHQAYGAIQSAVNSGILQGYDGKFHGKRLLNRYQIATILVKLLAKAGITTDTIESMIHFTDVPKGFWAYDAVQYVVEAGMLQGYDGKFHGKRLLNRYQMAVIIAKLLAKM